MGSIGWSLVMTTDKMYEKELPKIVLIDLCTAFISANGVRHEFAYMNAQRLVDDMLVGLDLDSLLLTFADEEDIWTLLMLNGYPRGDYVARLVARRIRKALMQINQQGGLSFLANLTQADFSQASRLLMPLYGVGPKFVETYCLLAGIDKNHE